MAMAKKGQRFGYRVDFRYEHSDTAGTVPVMDIESARIKAVDLAWSAHNRDLDGTFTIVAVSADGTRSTVETHRSVEYPYVREPLS